MLIWKLVFKWECKFLFSIGICVLLKNLLNKNYCSWAISKVKTWGLAEVTLFTDLKHLFLFRLYQNGRFLASLREINSVFFSLCCSCVCKFKAEKRFLVEKYISRVFPNFYSSELLFLTTFFFVLGLQSPVFCIQVLKKLWFLNYKIFLRFCSSCLKSFDCGGSETLSASWLYSVFAALWMIITFSVSNWNKQTGFHILGLKFA